MHQMNSDSTCMVSVRSLSSGPPREVEPIMHCIAAQEVLSSVRLGVLNEPCFVVSSLFATISIHDSQEHDEQVFCRAVAVGDVDPPGPHSALPRLDRRNERLGTRKAMREGTGLD